MAGQPQFRGARWEYRSGLLQEGQLAPVQCYTRPTTDLSPVPPQEAGHTWCGWAEVAGWDAIPDPEYHGGTHRVMRVRGPVVNRDRTVVLDAAPVLVWVGDY